MPDLDDFYAFKSTSEGNHGGSTGGCLGSVFKWVLIVLVFLWVISKLSG